MFRGVCILVLLALSVSAQDAASAKSRVQAAKQKCEADPKVTEVPKGNLTEEEIKTRRQNCATACLWTEMGMVNADNTFNVTQWIAIFPNLQKIPPLVQALNECSLERDPDLCKTANKFTACLMRKAAKINSE